MEPNDQPIEYLDAILVETVRWQPMSSAPRDGTTIMLKTETDGVVSAYWDDDAGWVSDAADYTDVDLYAWHHMLAGPKKHHMKDYSAWKAAQPSPTTD